MHTPAHLIFGAAMFARPHAPKVTAAALAGAFAPDLSLYVMAGWHLLTLGTSADVVFRQLYYSDAWMSVFSIDNSFFIWGAILGFGLWLKRNWLAAFAGAGLLHLALDFPLHVDDGRPHFWPLSDWKFVSPVSYWDLNHYGGIVGPLEILASLICLFFLWRRFHGAWPRALIAIAACLQIAPGFLWLFLFSR